MQFFREGMGRGDTSAEMLGAQCHYGKSEIREFHREAPKPGAMYDKIVVGSSRACVYEVR